MKRRERIRHPARREPGPRRTAKRGRSAPPPVLADDDPQSLLSLSAAYLEVLETRHYSAYTLESKGRYLRYFTDWCKDRGITRPSQVTLSLLERHQRWLFHYRTKGGQPLSLHSQRSRLAALRTFFRWLTRHRYLDANPASELVIPRRVRYLPRDIMTAEEAEQVLRQPDLTEPSGVRDRVMLEVFYATGMRRFELVKLKLIGIDLVHRRVMIRQGKGLKDRVVPLGERAGAWLEKYLADIRPQFATEPDDGTVFLTPLGEEFHPATVTRLVRRYVLQSGIPKKGACHLFRHTAATLMLEGGADVRYIQELLGHAELESTQIYTHVAITKLETVHRNTHPGARLERRSNLSPSEEEIDERDRFADLLLELDRDAVAEEDGEPDTAEHDRDG